MARPRETHRNMGSPRTLRATGWLLLAGLAGAIGGCSDEQAKPETEATGRPAPRPNVLLISLDTLRADSLSVMGYARQTSPHIDGLAGGGAVFTRAYAQANCTAPSHMSLMTGLYPGHHGVRQWQAGDDENLRLSPSIPTLASLLSAAGYATEAYTGGGNVRPELGFDQGFDRYEKLGSELDQIVDGTRGALERLAQGDAPWLLFMHTFEVHDPYTPPDDLVDRFLDEPYGGGIHQTRAALALATDFDASKRSATFFGSANLDDPRDVRRLKELYDAGIVSADRAVGRVLDRLHELGIEDDTVVILLSDHGDEFLEHGGLAHRAAWQELLHVPLVLRWPARPDLVPPGRRVDEVVSLVDVLPTLLSILELPQPEPQAGRSLLPLDDLPLRGEPVVVSQWLRGGFHSLRVGRWKLITHLSPGTRRAQSRQLFDLFSDPGETTDVAQQNLPVFTQLVRRQEALFEEQEVFRAGLTDSESITLDDETRAQLEGLGYLGR